MESLAPHITTALGLVLGLVLHMLKKHQECRIDNPGLTLYEWVAGRPYRSATAVVGALVGYLVLFDTGQLTIVAAVGVGYMADSVPDALAQRARSEISSR